MSGTSQIVQTQGKELFPMWLQVIVLVLFIVVMLWILKNVIKDLYIAIFSKKITIHAKLEVKEVQQFVNKKMFVTQGGGGVNDGIAEKGFDYILEFETDDGNIVRLIVPKQIYEVAVEGSQGVLVYKGNTFISYDGLTEGTVKKDDIIQNNFVGLNKKF